MGDDPTYNSISTQQISTALITASTIYARTSISTQNIYAGYLNGDGSGLSNLRYESFSTTSVIPPSSYGAFTIPWNAMEDEGSINLRSATWTIEGKIAATNVSVQTLQAKSLDVSSIYSLSARIGSLVSPVICSFYISTASVKADTIFFNEQYGNVIVVNSSIVKSLSTDTLTTNTLNLNTFTAGQGRFSTISTGTWEVNAIKSDSLQLVDLSSLNYSYVTLSANSIYLNNSSILSNALAIENLVSTTRSLTFNLYVASNFLNAHDSLSSLNSTTLKNFSTTWVGLSTLSTAIANVSSQSVIGLSNLSVSLNSYVINLSTDTAIVASNTSTTITNRLSNFETTTGNNFTNLSNYVYTQDSILKIGLSTVATNVSQNASTQVLNLSTSSGVSISTLTVGLSSVALIIGSGLATSLSTISTQIASNTSTFILNLSTAISNLSTSDAANYVEFRQGISTNASNINNTFICVFSSLSSTGVLQSVSSFSTSVGNRLVLLSNSLAVGTNGFITYVNDNTSFVLGVTGSNSSNLRNSLSNLSTSTESTFTNVQTTASFNFLTSQIAFSTLSTTVGSNTSSLSNISLSVFSTLSTTIGQTSNYLGYFSSVSTSIGSTNSTIYSILALGISSISSLLAATNIASSAHLSTLELYVSSISSANITSKTMNTSSFITSTFSTGLGFFSRFQGSTISSLTQQIGWLTTTQITASSFSGNLNDATTLLIQRI